MVLIQQNTNLDIDVIIPVFNGASFIEKALSSVQRQTYLPRKIIVVDDGSTDRTKQIVLDFSSKNTIAIEYIYQENGGPNKARNKGIGASSATLLAFLDADDEWVENKLEEQVKIFQVDEFENTGLVYCSYSLIDTDSETLIDNYAVTLDTTYKGQIFDKVLTANKIIGSASAVLIKRECFTVVGTFDESLKVSEDWDMWIRISEKFAINYVNKALVKIRRHANNFQKKYKYMLINDILFYNKWIERLDSQKVPLCWKDNIATLIFLGFPSAHFLHLAKKTLTTKSLEVLFGKYGGIDIYILIAIFKKGFKLIKNPRLLISKLRLLKI